MFVVNNEMVKLADQLNGKSFEWGVTDCICIALIAMSKITGNKKHWIIIDWHDKKSALETFEVIKPESYLFHNGFVKIGIRDIAPGDILVGVVDEMPTAQVVVGRMLLSSHPSRGVFCQRFDYEKLEALQLTAWRFK